MGQVRPPFLLCVDSLLNHCYLLVSGSVRARRGVVGWLGLGIGLGLQLGIGIEFRRNHSWSSIFTPRRNHSLCLTLMHIMYFFCTCTISGELKCWYYLLIYWIPCLFTFLPALHILCKSRRFPEVTFCQFVYHNLS